MGEKTFLVAVATTDEKTVNLHFGHAEEFSVYRVNAETGEGTLAEKRRLTETGCDGEGCYGSEAFDRIAEQLSDVEYVLAAKIGPHAVNALSRRQIIALDITAPIDEALRRVSEYRDKKKLISQRAKQILADNGIEE